jgi:DNA-binding NtrC family response regulator
MQRGGAHLEPTHRDSRSVAAIAVAMDQPFKAAKQAMIDAFERIYVRSLLDKHGGNISAVSRAAGIERVSIYSIMRRLGLEKAARRDSHSADDPDESCKLAGKGTRLP